MLEALDDVAAQPAAKPQAFRRQIGALNTGESAAKAVRISIDSDEARDLPAFTRRFRISVDSEVSKQRKSTGRSFVVEQASVVAGGGFILILAVVTRIDEQQAENDL